MQTPLYVRPLTADERATLETGLRSLSAFTVRRCQMLLASAEGQPTTAIARQLRCTDQTVRHAIHAFHQRGLAVLQPRSSRPHTTSTIFDAGTCESLRALLHQSPRTFAKPTSRWTLQLAAEVSFAQGLTPRLVSDETIRLALHRLGISWKRAKHWLTSPDPAYARKKNRRDRLIQRAMAQPTWALGFSDEVWWSRLAQPDQQGWTDADATPKLQERRRRWTTLIPRHWRVMACWCGWGRSRRTRCGSGLWPGAPLVRSPSRFWPGAPPSSQSKASPPCC
jgi:transposase